jgi:hypothetical protein
MSESESAARRRWINVGELIALAALIVSAVGVWIAWKSNNEEKTTRVVEQRSVVPLALRGTADSDGRTLTIVPADPSHALEGLTITVKARPPIEIGSDGRVSASDVETSLRDSDKQPKDVALSVPIRIEARYIEMGKDRRGGGRYVLRYKWEGGGLFGGRSLHLTGLSKG